MSYPFSAISSWQEAVLIAGTNILTQFFGFIPKLFGALVIFFWFNFGPVVQSYNY